VKIPLWRRIVDLVAFGFCALAAVGFVANAILDDHSTGGRIWTLGIAAVLCVMLWRAAPVVLRRQR